MDALYSFLSSLTEMPGLAGFSLGFICAYTLRALIDRKTFAKMQGLLAQTDAIYKQNLEATERQLQESFARISMDVMDHSTNQLVKHVSQQLSSERELTAKEVEGRKQMIDSTIDHLRSDLGRVTSLLHELEKDRQRGFGELASRLQSTNEQTAELIRTTQKLNLVLGSSRARGQWGERIADDILQAAGFIENVNYMKQQSTLSDFTRPDFTFLLPKGMKLHMDVKFPLDNYSRYLNAADGQKDKFKKDFMRDVRARIKELTLRGYIDPKDQTVDCVLMLIPNEGIFAFVVAEEPEIIDYAMSNQVICCSPCSLLATLAVIRQAVDHFAMEQTSTEILELLFKFRKNWEKYLDTFGKLGRRIDECQREYEHLAGLRTQQLDRSLEKLTSLRLERLAATVFPDSDGTLAEDSEEKKKERPRKGRLVERLNDLTP